MSAQSLDERLTAGRPAAAQRARASLGPGHDLVDRSSVSLLSSAETVRGGSPRSSIFKLQVDDRLVVGRPAPAVAARQRIDPSAVTWAVRLADVAIVIASGVFAFREQQGLSWPVDPTTAFAALSIVAMTLPAATAQAGLMQDFLRRRVAPRVIQGALRVLLPFVLVVGLVIALLPADNKAAEPLLNWLCVWAFGAAAGIVDVRLILAAFVRRWRNHGRLQETVAIYGTGDVAERLLERLQDGCEDSIEVVGVFDDRGADRVASLRLRAMMRGSANDLIALSRQREIDRVVVALPHAAEERVLEVLNKLRQMPVEISLGPDRAGFNLPVGDPTELAGLPLLAFYRRPLNFGQCLMKNCFDKIVAVLLSVFFAPLLFGIAVAIKLDSKGPVLFRQNRYGFGHRVIRVYKFRTMQAAAADPNGTSQTCANDPRVTRVGRFLRRWSFDELPQLLNVLHGEMSLVGPRPHAISMRVDERLNEDIVPDYALRHHLKPGITGWAQVNGYHGPVTSEEALRARVAHDLEYINRWSLWFDLLTLVLTFKVCFGNRHDY